MLITTPHLECDLSVQYTCTVRNALSECGMHAIKFRRFQERCKLLAPLYQLTGHCMLLHCSFVIAITLNLWDLGQQYDKSTHVLSC